MKIGVIGASGFIGKVFCECAEDAGHAVVRYSRSPKADTAEKKWRIFNDEPDLSGLDAVVNYAGESVAQRWNEKKKALFHTSRVGVTETITRQIELLPADERPAVLFNTSAVGYYGDCGDRELTEDSPRGTGYLSDLCLEWETAAYAAEALGLRVVIGRVGIVLGAGGDAWEQMQTAFKLGAGGRLGPGTQWMPWVDVLDVALSTLFTLETETIKGAVNLVSPDPRKNQDFTETLGKHLNRPTIIPAPEFALKLVFGEFGKHLLDSYRVYPQALESAGYSFTSAKLEAFFNKG